MYLSYYGLEFNPFDKDIETKYAYETDDLRILKNRLKFVKENKTMALVTGNPGMGKTFAIRNFINDLNRNLYKVIYICMSTVTTYEFYKQLCYELGIEPPFKKVDMFREIQERILNLSKDKKINVIIILDEAQYLKTGILNDLKILLNFDLDSKNYVSLILVGQPVLNSILRRNIFDALSQRITVSYNMVGFNKQELKDYIDTRIKIAHGNNGIFNDQAIEAIFNACNGSIRVANNIITKSLIIGKSKQLQTIDSNLVLEAVNDLALG